MSNAKQQILNRIKWSPLANDQYIREVVTKKTIYVHHTAGNPNPYGVLKWWNETSDRVGTAFIIGGKSSRKSDNWKDGELVQAFSSKYWAYHLGLTQSNLPPGSESSYILNAQAIGIELCNWGYLTKRNGQFYTYVNSIVSPSEVIDLGYEYRGYRYWHAYTDEQLKTLEVLLTYLGEEYHIPLCYKGDAMFDLDIRAFQGESGVWTHTSVRADKTDCSPQPHLIDVLKRVGGTT